MLDYGIQVILG